MNTGDYCECRECESVLSPSAYLVDLLHNFLDSVPANWLYSVLGVLGSRRPDLLLLKLNCENTELPIPYIDLVNEVLEACIVYKLSLPHQLTSPFDPLPNDTMARREAGRESPLTDEQWRQAHAMFQAGSANAYLDSLAGPSSSPPTERPLDLAAAIVAAMRRKGYVVDTQPGEINIVYVEGLNEDGTINDDAADKWNDLRVVIGFEGDKPVILGKWRATTEPGRYYTEHPVNPAGAARIEFGQYQAWRVGMHRGDHEALVQRGKVTACRDLNKDMIRTGDARDIGDNFGINQHGPSGTDEAPDNVGKFSAGCLVGKTMAGHRAFMAIVKADPRFVADPEYLFRTAILAERDVVPAA